MLLAGLSQIYFLPTKTLQGAMFGTVSSVLPSSGFLSLGKRKIDSTGDLTFLVQVKIFMQINLTEKQTGLGFISSGSISTKSNLMLNLIVPLFNSITLFWK